MAKLKQRLDVQDYHARAKDVVKFLIIDSLWDGFMAEINEKSTGLRLLSGICISLNPTNLR